MFTDRQSYWSALAVTAAITLAAARGARAADAPPAEPSTQELLNKVNDLQSQVDQLKQIARQQQADAQEKSADATASALKHEAEGYGSLHLSPEGFTSGYNDNRFVIQSSDGRFVLRPWLQLQARYEETYRDNAQRGGTGADSESGFEIRRLKFGFDGNAISPNLTYLLQFAVDRKTGILSLEQAWGKYHIGGGNFYVKGGQYKEPLDHEQILASRNLTAVDRTLSNDLFSNSEGFVQGISLGFESDGPVRAELAFTDGQRSANTNFQNFSTGGNTADWGAAGRAEYKVFGSWKDYDRSTGAYDAKGDFLAFGVGADYTEAGDTHTLTHVIDADYGTKSGFALYGAFTGRAFSHAAIGSLGSNGGTTGTAVGTNGYDWSFRSQASYAIDAHWEPYAQYEYLQLNRGNLPAGAGNQIQVLRAGVNYYLLKSIARITFDANYLPEGSPVSDDGIGILATGKATTKAGFSHGGGNEFIFRAQFQLNL